MTVDQSHPLRHRKDWRRVLLATVLTLMLSAHGQEPLPTVAPPKEPEGKAEVGELPVKRKGNEVTYQLPFTEDLSKTYRVTLAAAPKASPNWLVATFVSGAARIVTKENQGKFTERWNGLDDNFMPVPPGDYVVRGIYMPAAKWHMDGQYHSLTAKYVTGVGDSWSPPPDQDRKFPWVYGHCFGGIRDIAPSATGMAAFLFKDIEDSWNPFLVDLKKPVGYDQVKERYPSDSAGGTYAACDGTSVWVANTDRRFPHIYRVDRKWGDAINEYGLKCVKLDAPATDIHAWADPEQKRRFVYLAQSAPENKLLIYDGDGATVLKSISIIGPHAITMDKTKPGTQLYVLHMKPKGVWAVTAVKLKDGLFTGEKEEVLTLKDKVSLLDFDVGSDGKFYFVAADKHQIVAIDPKTKKETSFGKKPTPGKFNKLALHAPARVAVWQDAEKKDRVLVIERGGPGRLSEWSPSGDLIRQWHFGHTAAYGYCLDPEEPTHLYHVSNSNELIRYKVDYTKATWEVDCVWPLPLGGRLHPKVVNRDGKTYVTFPGGAFADWRYAVYRIVGDKCLPSAAIIPDTSRPKNQQITHGHWWSDANGDGQVQKFEHRPGRANLPGTQYWGDRWLSDLSLVAINSDGKYMRLAPTGFDQHGNPVYDGSQWKLLLADPIHQAQALRQSLPALFGGNEMPAFYGLHWSHVAGTPKQGFYVVDSFGKSNPGGIDTAGSYFNQIKLSRYVPDGKGGYTQRWRIGRKALRLMERGEMYAGHHLSNESAGMVGVFDSNGIYHVFTNKGLFVDTIGKDAFRYGLRNTGMYASGGEHWHGSHYQSKKDNSVYLCMGQAQMTVYKIPEWKLDTVKPLQLSPPTIRMSAAHIHAPLPLASKLRGGDNVVKAANFYASKGGPPDPEVDDDWIVATPVKFPVGSGQSVQVQCMFDQTNLYLRWHVRTPGKFQAKAVSDMSRLFTTKAGIDTVSFYIQGDTTAGLDAEKGRPGDLRIVFAIIKGKDGKPKPVALGMYPEWSGKKKPTPATYISEDGMESYAHVTRLDQVKLAYKLDENDRGFWIAAAIPVTAIPNIKTLRSGFRTMVNFEAAPGGQKRYRWAHGPRDQSSANGPEPAAARFHPGTWSHARFVW